MIFAALRNRRIRFAPLLIAIDAMVPSRGLAQVTGAGQPALTTASAPADAPVSGSFELGLGTGIALAVGGGTLTARQPMAAPPLVIPLRVHAGYRFAPRLVFAGAYLRVGPLACKQCAVDARAGGVLHYHPRASSSIDPWVGVGLGYEVIVLSFSDGLGAKSGFVIDALELGVSFPLGRTTRAGPFIGCAITILNGPLSLDAQPELPAANVWAGGGVLVTFGP